jgi:F-type H+-transporting ATPase subunit b
MITHLIPLAENPLFPKLPEIIASVVFALLLTVVIRRFVVPRFDATYAERTAAIQGGLEKAEKAQAAEAALQEYNARLAEARTRQRRPGGSALVGTQILRSCAIRPLPNGADQGRAQPSLEAELTQVIPAAQRSAGLPSPWRADAGSRSGPRRHVVWSTALADLEDSSQVRQAHGCAVEARAERPDGGSRTR